MRLIKQLILILLVSNPLSGFTQIVSADSQPAKTPDVFVVGRFNTGKTSVPAYWKNGDLVKLSEKKGNADFIAIDGDDVYVIGSLEDGSNKTKLWRNGVMTNFTDESGVAIHSLRIFKGDLYAVGSMYGAQGWDATYWKNGSAHSVATGMDSFGNDIIVIGNDVYIVGLQYNANGHGVAKYWKNGEGIELTDGTADANAKGIVVISSDVYVSGEDAGTLKIWKNNVPTSLGAIGASGTHTGSIAVINNDVYVVGYEVNYEAKYWKNGKLFMLPRPEGISKAYGYSITTMADNIFFFGAGYKNGEYPPLVWKNFELVAPYDGTFISLINSMTTSK